MLELCKIRDENTEMRWQPLRKKDFSADNNYPFNVLTSTEIM